MPSVTHQSKKGSSYDRRKRKIYLLSLGNGETVECWRATCKAVLTYETVQADRIDRSLGYARSNILPACGPCNATTWTERPIGAKA